MSSTSPTSSSSTVFGTNVAPISFPGIASGIDYNSIISKYTALTMQQATPLQNQVTKLSAQQAELLKIQSLISKFQDSFTALSDPANFTATAATASQTGLVSLSDIPNTSAIPGTYTIKSTQLATATQDRGSISANGTLNQSVPLAQAGFAITPQNGTNSSGASTPATLTVDGTQITGLDVNSATFTTLLTKLNAVPGVSASLNPSGQLVITQTGTTPLTVGSAGDVGNLLHALKLDTASVTSTGSGPSTVWTITSSGPIAGINVASTLNQNNNAGFATAVTAGSFTINGVAITVDPTQQNLTNVIQAINSSSAGVLATFDQTNQQIVLTNKTTGSQSILLGSSSDTSNFLQAAGLLQNYQTPGTLQAGATQTAGQSASVTYLDSAGNTKTAYSASNDVTNVIPGIDIKLLQTTTTPFSINVAQDSSALQTDLGNFVTAYNAVMDEINTATQAPAIGSTTTSTGSQASQQLTNGGVLFNNQDVLTLRDQLINLMTATSATSTSYNSLASVGLTLDSSFSVAAATSGSTTNTTSQDSVTLQTFSGTSGRLNTLDTTKLTAAIAANPNAVSQLFVGTSSLIGQLGSYLTTVTGLPTQLTGGLAGSVPKQSLFNTLVTQSQDQSSQLQAQIKVITDQANLQADSLRQQFLASETTIAQLQAQQGSLSSLFGKTG